MALVSSHPQVQVPLTEGPTATVPGGGYKEDLGGSGGEKNRPLLERSQGAES